LILSKTSCFLTTPFSSNSSTSAFSVIMLDNSEDNPVKFAGEGLHQQAVKKGSSGTWLGAAG
jgi:hypothetical protein